MFYLFESLSILAAKPTDFEVPAADDTDYSQSAAGAK
jgi:hypothetical protein